MMGVRSAGPNSMGNAMTFLWVAIGTLAGWFGHALWFRVRENELHERGKVVAQMQDYVDTNS
jgi:hypothetical protein